MISLEKHNEIVTQAKKDSRINTLKLCLFLDKNEIQRELDKEGK